MKQFITFVALLAFLTFTGLGVTHADYTAQSATSPGDSVKQFARAMEANDPKTVGNVVPQLKALLSEEKLKEMVKEASQEIKAEGGIKSITIDKEKIEGDKAVVTATLENGKGEKETDDFDLVKKDGKWVIHLEFDDKEEPGEEEEPE